MITVGSSAGGDALYLREIHTRATPSERSATVDTSPRDAPSHTSLGRLLRLVADPRSDENHMNAAIAHVDGSGKRPVSEGIGELPTPKAVFSLSDHRHISNLETVLRAADRAISEQETLTTQNAAASRNLLRALATALVTQSVEECSSTKANLCVWTSQSKKRLHLLQWMLIRGAEAARIVLEETIAVQLSSQDPQAKSSQLTACLVVLELAQRLRRDHASGILGDWAYLVGPLVALVQNNTVQTSTGAKPSKLGVVALDALLAVLCVATLESSESARPMDRSSLSGMESALKTLIEWNARSSKRQWLVVAARQLLAMTSYCARIKSRDTEAMIAWHWNAMAMWLCSRSDAVLAAKKQLTTATIRTILDVHDGANPSEARDAPKIKSAHSMIAFLRRLCILQNLHSGGETELRKGVFADFEVAGKLLISLATALTAPATQDLAAEMLRLYLLGRSHQGDMKAEPLFLLADSETRAFISLVVKLNIEAGDPKSDPQSDVVAAFVAEVCLASGVSIMSRLQTSMDADGILFWLSVLSQALQQYRVAFAHDPPLCSRWFRDATLAVLRLVHETDKNIRVAALRMLSKLDIKTAMEAVGSTQLYEQDPKTSGGLVTLLFLYAEQRQEPSTFELANVLMDTLFKGSEPRQEKSISDPSGFGHDAVTTGYPEERRQELAMVLSVQGWCRQATESTRKAVLSILVGKVFASPRDPSPLSWLRELSLLGWFDHGLAPVLPVITGHMQALDRLTETVLEDDSTQASRTVEQLLFARLAPNLVLRVIPRAAFLALYERTPSKLLDTQNHGVESDAKSHSQHFLQDLAQLLWSQVLDPLEFKDVKMLAIELLTKLPAQEILPHVLSQLHAFLREQGSPLHVVKTLKEDLESDPRSVAGGGFVTAKLMMYYLNRLVTDDASGSSSCLTDEKIWSSLLTVLSLPCDPEEAFSAQRSPLVDLQMGAIECLGLLVSKSLSVARRAHDLHRRQRIEDVVVELIANGPVSTASTDESENGLYSKWRAAVHDVDETRDHFSVSQLQICSRNVLLSCLSKLDDATLPAFQDLVVRSSIPGVSIQNVPEAALAGRLQVAFSYVFRAGATLEPEDPASAEIVGQSVSAVVEILHSPTSLGDQVYMSTLKLLGALIGKVSWLWPSLSSTNGGTQQALAAGLQRLRDSPHPVAPPVRQLAQSLLQAILPA